VRSVRAVQAEESLPAVARALAIIERTMYGWLATGARHGMSPISELTLRGHMWFMIIDKGSVNADAFIEFLKRLIKGAERKLFLIVDRGSDHRVKKVSAFVETLGGKLRMLFLPLYAPDHSPDELVWKHLKADTIGRMVATSREVFEKKVRGSMRDRQNDKRKIISFFQKTSLKYAA
jgi:transposase